ncbi:uncharacterized protein LOC143239560 [Tachypleus tridentatus]|uniref:uncharacterized protein LOC143239560 n=1 Tax=Tachypleus tridentatus TaxID=6853 RepID=UPI003FD4FEB7
MEDRLQTDTETAQQPEVGVVDQEEVKAASSGLNKNLLRCLLLLLPVAIPVVIYLRDVASTQRIFLTTFVLLLVVIISCVLMALLRAHRRHLEDAMPNNEVTREFAQNRVLTMTNRFVHRPLNSGRSASVSHEVPGIRSFAHSPVHYHLASHYHSCSPSPQVPSSPVSIHSSCHQLSTSSLRQSSRSPSMRQHSLRSPTPLSFRSPSPYRTRRSFRRHSSSSPPPRIQSSSQLPRPLSPYRAPLSPALIADHQVSPPIAHPEHSRSLFFSTHVSPTHFSAQVSSRDDPPSYEAALGCPRATVCSPEEVASNVKSESPPPSYDRVIT